MTISTLRESKYSDLAQMAKLQGVVGWHAMCKDELIQSLLKVARKKKNGIQSSPGPARSKPSAARHPFSPTEASQATKPSNGKHPNSFDKRASLGRRKKVQEQIDQYRADLSAVKNLSLASNSSDSSAKQDRLVVMVRDPYWLHVHWELTQQRIERARTALNQHWHMAKPILRLYRVTSGGTLEIERQIPIHGAVNHWYIDVRDPPCEFRVEIGYLTSDKQFHCLARSNSVTTPPSGTSDSVDENWSDVADNVDRIFAMSGGYSPNGTSLELQELLEERLNRPLGTPMQTRYGRGATSMPAINEDLQFAVDAELLIYGVSDPHAHVTLNGEPVALKADGGFAVRLSLPDHRQVIPIVASSADGVEQQTIILGIDRNTKVLEPRIREPGN